MARLTAAEALKREVFAAKLFKKNPEMTGVEAQKQIKAEFKEEMRVFRIYDLRKLVVGEKLSKPNPRDGAILEAVGGTSAKSTTTSAKNTDTASTTTSAKRGNGEHPLGQEQEALNQAFHLLSAAGLRAIEIKYDRSVTVKG